MPVEFDVNDEGGRGKFSLYGIDDVEDGARAILKSTTLLAHTVSRPECCIC